MININEVVDRPDNAIGKGWKSRDGFIFTSICNPMKVYDAIVIKYPHDVACDSPIITGAKKTLKEQIDFINKYQIEKAFIIANNIEFIRQCPSLKYMVIVPADNTGNNFDYSPLYEMNEIKYLCCSVVYGKNNEYKTEIDFSKIKGLQDISVGHINHKNFCKVKTLKSIAINNNEDRDLLMKLESKEIDSLMLRNCKIENLNGIENFSKMQCLYLFGNKRLNDISSLLKVKKSLKALRICNSSKIGDFSVLGNLDNLELLELTGTNSIPNLEFLNDMKSLKVFTFTMNIEDGNLLPCMKIPYVFCEKGRKHYNLKDSDLSKNKDEYVHGNESIEEWRRFGNY